MRVKNVWSLTLIILLIILTFASYQFFGKNKAEEYTSIPPNGFVPDEITAIKIAEAIWQPLYGTMINVNDEKPFKAELRDGQIWIVQGTSEYKSDYRGGVAYIEIQKSDCKILKVGHGR